MKGSSRVLIGHSDETNYHYSKAIPTLACCYIMSHFGKDFPSTIAFFVLVQLL